MLSLNSLAQRLSLYDTNEARSIVRMLLEDSFGLSFTDICCGGIESLSDDNRERLNEMMLKLEQGVPIQHVTGKAWFCDRKFMVNENVLIPRPETEELCQWINSVVQAQSGKSKMLDIGTGSGCIAITLAKDNPRCSVSAWDISEDALNMAEQNAKRQEASVEFMLQDALHAPDDHDIYDIIVSNPPYICDKERVDMEPNVIDHEPHLALFVPDGSPLLFYSAIAQYASHALKQNGMLFFEINPLYHDEMIDMLKGYGFIDIECKEDMFGKQRMMKASKPLVHEK